MQDKRQYTGSVNLELTPAGWGWRQRIRAMFSILIGRKILLITPNANININYADLSEISPTDIEN